MKGKVISTITGTTIPAEEDLRELLCRQLTAPVRFMEAAMAAAADVDLFVEVGPGEILGHLVSEFVDKPCVSLDAGGESLLGLLKAAGAAFASGACVDPSVLFAGRIAKPFSLDWQPRSDDEHRALLKAVEQKRTEAACKLLREHILDAGRALAAALERK